MPGSPKIVTSWARRSRTARANAFSSSSSSSSRPTYGATTLSGLPIGRSVQMTRRTCMPSRRPLRGRPTVGSVTTRSVVSPYAVGPIRISPGSADCWRRAATFSASPVAKVESPSSTTTSPASIPIRTGSSSLPFSTIATAARTARSASSSCAVGTPKTARTASPANFSTVPP